MRARRMLAVLGVVLGVCLADDSVARGQGEDALRMSKPVLCRKIHGYASFEEWPSSTMTADDKLTIYFEPSGYKIEKIKEGFRAFLSEDARIRRKGQKTVLWKKENMVEYEAKSPMPPYQIFVRSDLAIKGLAPGEYELDLTLHDRLAKDAQVVRTVPFTIVVPTPKARKDGAASGS